MGNKKQNTSGHFGRFFLLERYNPISAAYFKAMVQQLDYIKRDVIDDAIRKTKKQILKQDCFMLTLATEQQSLLWVNDPTKTGIKVNSPTFTPFKGWMGNLTNYIDTGLNPGDGYDHKMKINDCCLFAYCNIPSNSISLSDRVLSDNAGQLRLFNRNNNSWGVRIASSNTVLSPFTSTIKEFFGGRRNNVNTLDIINNKTNVNISNASSGIANENIFLYSQNTRVPLFGLLSYLTDQELSDFQDAWLPVLEHLGSDYWSNYVPTTLTATAVAGKIDLAWTFPITTYSPYTVINCRISSLDDVRDLESVTAPLGAVNTYELSVPSGETRKIKIMYKSSRGIWSQYSAELEATAL